MIWCEQFNSCIHATELKIFDQNFSFAHEIHRMACMTSLLVLASNLRKMWWNLVSMLLTYHNPCRIFSVVSNTRNFWTILLWLFTYPWSLMDGEGWTFHKISSTHLNLNLEYVLESMSLQELMGKKSFWYFEFDPIATLKP